MDKKLGKHCFCELYKCSPTILNDEERLISIIKEAINKAGATLLNIASHKFSPQGVTIVALLSESHISIHTWPEDESAAIDVFTCGDAKPELAIWHMILELKALRHNTRCLER